MIPATAPEITSTDCQQCGTSVYGLDGRYACTGCGWTNTWSDGYTELPSSPTEE